MKASLYLGACSRRWNSKCGLVRLVYTYRLPIVYARRSREDGGKGCRADELDWKCFDDPVYLSSFSCFV